jgi:excisionase family DNA binding protein
MDRSRFVGIREAAEILGMSYSAVWEALRRGDFPAPAVQVGTLWRISRPGLEALAGGRVERGGEES